MKDHLLDRIYGEYQAYKASVLGGANAEIFSRCYEIDIMTNIYDILAERIENLSDDVVEVLLSCKNILSELYERWLKKDDSIYAELDEYVSNEVDSIAAEIKSGNKGREVTVYGAEDNQIA